MPATVLNMLLTTTSPTSSSPPLSPLPTQTYHPSIIVPTPALVGSVAGAAHYSGSHTINHRRLSHERRTSHSEDVHAEHQRVLDDLKELYCARPTPEIFNRTWTKDAIFEGPLVCSKGYAEYAPQWYALPKFCSRSETISTRVLSSTSAPNRIIYSQSQEYTLRIFGAKIIQSVIIVDLDDDDKIVRLIDQWEGKDLPTRFGTLFLRRANAKLTGWFIRVPPLRS